MKLIVLKLEELLVFDPSIQPEFDVKPLLDEYALVTTYSHTRVRTKDGKDLHRIPADYTVEELSKIAKRAGRALLDAEGFNAVYNWQRGGGGDFHRHLMKAFEHADGGNLQRLSHGFPGIASMLETWRKLGTGWLFNTARILGYPVPLR